MNINFKGKRGRAIKSEEAPLITAHLCRALIGVLQRESCLQNLSCYRRGKQECLENVCHAVWRRLRDREQHELRRRVLVCHYRRYMQCFMDWEIFVESWENGCLRTMILEDDFDDFVHEYQESFRLADLIFRRESGDQLTTAEIEYCLGAVEVKSRKWLSYLIGSFLRKSCYKVAVLYGDGPQGLAVVYTPSEEHIVFA